MNRPRLRSPLLPLLAAALFASGCGTLGSWVVDRPSPYSGVRLDAWILAGRGVRAPWGGISIPLAVLDLPLSLVADSLLLPCTIPIACDRAGEVDERDGALAAMGAALALFQRLEPSLSAPDAGPPYLVGRVAPIDLDGRVPYLHLWRLLPADLRARDEAEVDSILGVSTLWRRGEPETLLQLIDARSGRVVYRKTLAGGDYPEIVNLMVALPRR